MAGAVAASSSSSPSPSPSSGPPSGRGLGRCAASFWLALAFDAVGLSILLSGVFADVFFADLLIYGGGLGIFFSLLWWVFWYVGNLEVPPAELQDDVGLCRRRGKRGSSAGSSRLGLRGSVRSLSRRISSAFSRPRGSGASASTASSARVGAVRSTTSVELELV
ncbi:transmembrane protein 238-like [Heteronotia binoei]|uniref:transmembrane protein 238-like n=1 Tax=Heteronotia binoei TaxID=13085 RepID=UPI00292EBD1D|nr:transmembrane protein 238-like [Heteronotia binoei]